jgi:AcrR family transcriptional regulator
LDAGVTGVTKAVGKRTPSADVERSLVDAAVAVLERDGPAALTVRAVAAEAGVAPMGVYNHLGGKDGLVAAVLIRGFDGLSAALNALSGQPPERRMRECGRAYRRFALRNPAVYTLMFGGSAKADGRDDVVEHAEAAFDALVGAVVATQQAGLVMAGEPFDLAMRIWSAVHGAMSLELAGSGPPNDDSLGTYERIIDMIEAGLAPLATS